MFNYEQYCQMCKEKKIENPYKNELDFNRAYRIERDSEKSLFQAKKKPQPKIKAGFEEVNKPKRERKYVKKRGNRLPKNSGSGETNWSAFAKRRNAEKKRTFWSGSVW